MTEYPRYVTVANPDRDGWWLVCKQIYAEDDPEYPLPMFQYQIIADVPNEEEAERILEMHQETEEEYEEALAD